MGSEKVISDQNVSPSRKETDFFSNQIVTKITLVLSKVGSIIISINLSRRTDL